MLYGVKIVGADGTELMSSVETWTSPAAVGRALGMSHHHFVQATTPGGVGYEMPHGEYAGSRAFIIEWISPALIVALKPGSCAPDTWHAALDHGEGRGAAGKQVGPVNRMPLAPDHQRFHRLSSDPSAEMPDGWSAEVLPRGVRRREPPISRETQTMGERREKSKPSALTDFRFEHMGE